MTPRSPRPPPCASAAGLVAFGAGLVGAALIPASEKEQQAAIAVKDKAQPLQQQVSDVAKDAAQNVKEPAQQAAQAAQAAQAVKDTAGREGHRRP